MKGTGDDYRLSGFRNEQSRVFPPIVNIEVFRGQCPCSCRHCPVGLTGPAQRRARFGFGAMGLADFKRIIDEISRFSHSVARLHAVGEPLCWADIETAAEYAKLMDVKSWLFTSGLGSHPDALLGLSRHISIIEISLNSTDAVDYFETKGVDAFAAVVERIGALRRHIDKFSLETRLIVSRVQSGDPAVDRHFTDYWQASGLVDDAFVRTYHSYNRLLDEQPSAIQVARPPCLVHWGRMNISFDGRVVVCFNELFRADQGKVMVLGNVRTRSIQEIWQSEPLCLIRKAELAGSYADLPFGDSVPCANCTECQPLFGDGVTSESQLQSIRGEADD